MSGNILRGPRPFIRTEEVTPAASGDKDKVDVRLSIDLSRVMGHPLVRAALDQRPRCKVCNDIATRGDLCVRCRIHEIEMDKP